MQNIGRRFLAELVGTFAFVFVGAGCIITVQGGQKDLLTIALAHGLALAVAVSATAHISGGHMNPAVTVAAWVARRIHGGAALLYIIAQLLGGFIAAGILLLLLPGLGNYGTPEVSLSITFWPAVLTEAVLTFLLVFTFFATLIDAKAPRGIGGFAVGAVLAAAILVGGPLTGAALNPARVLGPAIVSPGHWANHGVYWLGPLVGGILAGALYGSMYLPEPEQQAQKTG
jgi:MIP family channel proteins